MNINEAVSALNQRLYDELKDMALTAKNIFLAGTAATDQYLAYQIVSEYDNEVSFNIVVGSDAAWQAAPYGTLEDAKITVFVVLHSRKGKATFRYGYEAKEQIAIKTDGGVSLDDLIPWIWLSGTEKTRLETDNDFPAANTVAVPKTITYTIDLGAETTVVVGNSVQAALVPGVTNLAGSENSWVTDNPNIATVSQWVLGGTLGGLITGVAAGQTYIRNSLGAKILVTVTE